ncbi:hypothetical protein SESBI_11750 [Sesbania bispinosa]|nr:hypothetical protein SESBI_11750 [Sesbania bispinosa]
MTIPKSNGAQRRRHGVPGRGGSGWGRVVSLVEERLKEKTVASWRMKRGRMIQIKKIMKSMRMMKARIPANIAAKSWRCSSSWWPHSFVMAALFHSYVRHCHGLDPRLAVLTIGATPRARCCGSHGIRPRIRLPPPVAGSPGRFPYNSPLFLLRCRARRARLRRHRFEGHVSPVGGAREDGARDERPGAERDGDAENEGGSQPSNSRPERWRRRSSPFLRMIGSNGETISRIHLERVLRRRGRTKVRLLGFISRVLASEESVRGDKAGVGWDWGCDL